MTKQRLGPNQERWLKALESVSYNQGRGRLTIISGDVEYDCCLGVGCKVFGIQKRREAAHINYDGVHILAPYSLVRTLALWSCHGRLEGRLLKGYRRLSEANDAGVTFAEIAAFCREYPEAVFSEPR